MIGAAASKVSATFRSVPLKPRGWAPRPVVDCGWRFATQAEYSWRMAARKFSFMLRLLDRNPDRVPMAHLGEYIQEFAGLLGEENKPIFKGIKTASTGCLAAVPVERTHYSRARITQAKTDETSKPGRHLHAIEALMGRDAITEAQILDERGIVIHTIFGIKPEPAASVERVFQEGVVDGWVTGLVGADDSMHLYVRDNFDRDLRLIVRDDILARKILSHFRSGTIRIRVRGHWLRNENGWAPEASKCQVLSFEPLEDTSFGEVLAAAVRVPGNGWSEMKDPIAHWESIRGTH